MKRLFNFKLNTHHIDMNDETSKEILDISPIRVNHEGRMLRNVVEAFNINLNLKTSSESEILHILKLLKKFIPFTDTVVGIGSIDIELIEDKKIVKEQLASESKDVDSTSKINLYIYEGDLYSLNCFYPCNLLEVISKTEPKYVNYTIFKFNFDSASFECITRLTKEYILGTSPCSVLKSYIKGEEKQDITFRDLDPVKEDYVCICGKDAEFRLTVSGKFINLCNVCVTDLSKKLLLVNGGVKL